MRCTGILSTYNRVILRTTAGPGVLSQSMLAFFGAGEATFIQRFVNAADADRTTYGVQ